MNDADTTPCGHSGLGEIHGSRSVSMLVVGDRGRAVREPIAILRRRCRTCGATWSEDPPGVGGVRVSEELACRIVGLSMAYSTRRIGEALDVPRDAVARIVVGNARERLERGLIRPPFAVRRVGRHIRIVDLAGEPVQGDALLLEAAGERFLRALGGPFLCDRPALARLRTLAPDVGSHLSREAAGEEAEDLLAVAVDRSAVGTPERRRAVERFGRAAVARMAAAFVLDDHASATLALATVAEDVGRALPSGAAPLVRFLRSGALPPAGLWPALDWRTWKAAGEPLYDPGIESIVRTWSGGATHDDRRIPGLASIRMSTGPSMGRDTADPRYRDGRS